MFAHCLDDSSVTQQAPQVNRMTESAMETSEGLCSSFGSVDYAGAFEQSYDPWAEIDWFGLEAVHVSPTNLEEIYAGIHRSIDQAISTISQRGHFAPETIRQQNSKVVEKLSGLENEALRHTPVTSTSSLSGVSTPAIPAGMYPDVVRL